MTGITVGQFRHRSMSTPRAMPTYHCVTRTNIDKILQQPLPVKKPPTPTFPATPHQWTDVCCTAVSAAKRCVCACSCVCVCVCVSHGDPMSARILEWVGNTPNPVWCPSLALAQAPSPRPGTVCPAQNRYRGLGL